MGEGPRPVDHSEQDGMRDPARKCAADNAEARCDPAWTTPPATVVFVRGHRTWPHRATVRGLGRVRGHRRRKVRRAAWLAGGVGWPARGERANWGRRWHRCVGARIGRRALARRSTQSAGDSSAGAGGGGAGGAFSVAVRGDWTANVESWKSRPTITSGKHWPVCQTVGLTDAAFFFCQASRDRVRGGRHQLWNNWAGWGPTDGSHCHRRQLPKMGIVYDNSRWPRACCRAGERNRGSGWKKTVLLRQLSLDGRRSGRVAGLLPAVYSPPKNVTAGRGRRGPGGHNLPEGQQVNRHRRVGCSQPGDNYRDGACAVRHAWTRDHRETTVDEARQRILGRRGSGRFRKGRGSRSKVAAARGRTTSCWTGRPGVGKKTCWRNVFRDFYCRGTETVEASRWTRFTRWRGLLDRKHAG